MTKPRQRSADGLRTEDGRLHPGLRHGVRTGLRRADELGQRLELRPGLIRHRAECAGCGPRSGSIPRNLWPGPAAQALELHSNPLLRHGAGAADALVPPPASQSAHALADLVGVSLVPRHDPVATHVDPSRIRGDRI
jgi:hypothetical protein